MGAAPSVTTFRAQSTAVTSPISTRVLPLAPHQAAHGPGDVGRRKPGTRNLVQERLENVVVLPVDQRDIGVEAPEPLGDGEAAETRANDDDSRF